MTHRFMHQRQKFNTFPDGTNLFLYVLFTWSNIFILTKKFDSGRNSIILDIEISAWSWFFVNLRISFFSFNITWRESFMESQWEARELCAQPMRNQKIKQILSEIQKCPMWICGSGLWVSKPKVSISVILNVLYQLYKGTLPSFR